MDNKCPACGVDLTTRLIKMYEKDPNRQWHNVYCPHCRIVIHIYIELKPAFHLMT